MTDTTVTLEFLGAQIIEMRNEVREMRAEIKDLGYGVTVVTEMVLRLQRDMLYAKDILGRLDARLSKVEDVR
jgi:hypothetical protein